MNKIYVFFNGEGKREEVTATNIMDAKKKIDSWSPNQNKISHTIKIHRS